MSRAQVALVGRLAITLLVVAFLAGGASRPDVVASLFVRIAAVAVLAAMVGWRLLNPGRWRRGEIAVWVLLLATPLVQMIPLPWSVWTALPGRDYPRELFELLGVRPWQPLTVVPDRTLNAFAALIPALAAFCLARVMDDKWLRRSWLAILVLALVSAMLGIFQILDGPDSALRFYDITVDDAAVGLFSNPNHHGLFLAMALPAIALWLDGQREPNRRLSPILLFGVGTAGAIMALATVLTFSRAGIALFALSAILTIWLLRLGRIDRMISFRTVAFILGGLAVLVVAGVIFRDNLALYMGIGQPEGRFDIFPKLATMIADSFPWGTGLGSLDAAFRAYETPDRLQFGYLNNAHNDYLQLLIEAGLVAAVGLVLFAFVIGRALSYAFREQADHRAVEPTTVCAVAVALPLLHSLIDYPLRTPALSVVFALSCGTLVNYGASRWAGRPAKRAAVGDSYNA